MPSIYVYIFIFLIIIPSLFFLDLFNLDLLILELCPFIFKNVVRGLQIFTI